MKKKYFIMIFITTVICSALLLTSYYRDGRQNRISPNNYAAEMEPSDYERTTKGSDNLKKEAENQVVASGKAKEGFKEPGDIGNVKPSKPTKSGPIDRFPWEQDENFLNAQNKNGANILMAGYCAVLHDPLPGEEYNVHLAARLLAGTVLQPGEVFSQNKYIGPYTTAKGFQKGPTYIGSRLTTTIGGGVCKIASTLYNVAIQSNLQIVQRHNHSMPVPYVPYGQDATVAYGARDIRFKNDTAFPILIWAQGVENTLYIGFYGKEKPPTVKWHHEMLKRQKAPIIYRTNENLEEGTEKVILEGMDGATVKSWVTIEKGDGSITTKHLGISYYNPMPYIIERNK